MWVRRLWCALSALALMVVAAVPAHALSYSELPDDALSWVPNGRVYDIQVTTDTVYIAGTFTSVRNPVSGQRAVRNRAAAFDRVTGALRPWNPNLDGGARTVEIAGDTAYIGGTFLSAGGSARARLVAVDAVTGAVRPDFVADASGEVRDLHAEGGSLWVAGQHTQVNGVPRPSLTKVDAWSGAVDESFDAGIGSGRLFALHRGPADTLLIGGSFKLLQGVAQNFLGAVQLSDGARVGWKPEGLCGTCSVLDLDLEDNLLGVGIAGPGGRAAVWDLSAWKASSVWMRRGDGDVQALSLRHGVFYAGGHFGPEFDGRTEHQLVTLDASTGERTPHTVPFTGSDQPGLWAVEALDDHLWIGGGFRGITGSAAVRYAVLPALPAPEPVPGG